MATSYDPKSKPHQVAADAAGTIRSAIMAINYVQNTTAQNGQLAREIDDAMASAQALAKKLDRIARLVRKAGVDEVD